VNERQGIGALIIVVSIFLLWAYNTGRLSAIFDAIVYGQRPAPSTPPSSGPGGAGKSLTTSGGAGKSKEQTAQEVLACGARISAGDFSCIGNIWTSVNSVDDIVNVVKGTANTIFGWTGIKF
jgi:hypothetical protein